MNGEEVLATFIVNSSDLADTALGSSHHNNGRDAVVSPCWVQKFQPTLVLKAI